MVEDTLEVHPLADNPDHRLGPDAIDRSAEMIPPLIGPVVTSTISGALFAPGH